MSTNYSNQIFKEYQRLLIEVEQYKKINASLNTNITELTKMVEELKAEILRLKTNNKKDSSNSNKPSGTDGYKKVKNNRTNSNNKKGKPKGSSSTNLSKEKLDQFLNSGNVLYETKEINKTAKNKDKKPMIFKILDVRIQKVCTEIRVYPNLDGSYDIPKGINRPIQYGNNLKTMCIFLNNDLYNSTDGITRFIEYITNQGISLSKSTILSWNSNLAKILTPTIDKIEEELLNSYYLNCDDSTIKINGNSYYDLCICNDKYTKLHISERKNHNAWKDKTILEQYKGIIEKDGTDVYNGFGIGLSQCGSHIGKYLKGIYDFVNHTGAKKMHELIQSSIHLRNQYVKQGKEEFTDTEIDDIFKKKSEILKQWKSEWMHSTPSTNAVYQDERKLLARFEDEEESEQIFYFIKDFKVPTTNNQAETDQRGLKVKQKIGKFRSVDGADTYAIIRSCILSYKKHKINVYDAILSAFNNNPIEI